LREVHIWLQILTSAARPEMVKGRTLKSEFNDNEQAVGEVSRSKNHKQWGAFLEPILRNGSCAESRLQ
jgi:hypothetical protein